ncbi:MAG: hypothetical protein ACYS22_11345 [Planctomycetota bacterium]|jgi:hypothetical protein
MDAVADRRDEWPPYGVGNYRPASKGTFYGRFKSEIRYEKADLNSGASGKDDDLDIYEHLTLGTDGVGLERLDTRFSGRWSKDIDGSRDPLSGADYLIDARDQYHERDRHLFEINTAYARYRAVEDALDVTVGRQHVTEAEWAHFDGIAIDAPRITKLVSFGAFLGRRVHYYGEWDEKAVGGGHVTFHLGDRIDLSLSDVAGEVNVFEAKAHIELAEGLLVIPKIKLIDENFDRLSLDTNYWDDDLGLDLTLNFAAHLTPSDGFEFGHTSADSAFKERFRIPEPSSYYHIEAIAYKEIVKGLFGVELGLIRHELFKSPKENGWESNYWEPWIGFDLNPIEALHLNAKATYADHHRPSVSPVTNGGFREGVRGEGEEHWFEFEFGSRFRLQDLLTLGGGYYYRHFQTHSGLVRGQEFDAHAFNVFGDLDVPEVDGLSLRVEYQWDQDLIDPVEGISRSEAVWASVEYAF